MKILNKFFIVLINFYRKLISPLLPQSCRFYPTCSEYAVECFQTFGFFKAFFLSIYRIIRCNPLSKGGYDPVDKHAH
ncbi:MAG: membrane protein insertion efficiency factor YidD [Deltaproteobacteria bacterium]|nr:membrane protein insertion efficiency factor YidD [Deltaproteobacteria bacterium]